MITIATILYLSYALYRTDRDLSIYQFDEPIIMWNEPKLDPYEIILGWYFKDTPINISNE